MPVITEIQTISETVSKIIDFIQENERIGDDFEEYLKTVGAIDLDGNIKVSESELQSLCIPYITERIIFPENKSITEIYLEENPEISALEKEIVEGLGNSISSIFEIEKRLQNGFALYNLVNEKHYTAIPLVKMNQLREVCPSQFALIRIFKLKEAYFILEISDLIPSYERENVMNFAVAKIIEKPEDLYFDNEEKFNEVKAFVEASIKNFKEFFKTDEIITTNKKIDNLIDLLDNFQKTKDETLRAKSEELIEKPEEYRYFKVNEFSNDYDTFIKNSMGGFSAHAQKYDVGYLCDEKLGVFIIPFWATLAEIFTSEGYKEIENYKDCVKTFIKNDKIPPSFIKRLEEKAKSSKDFEKRLQEIMEENLTTDEFIKKYKGEYLKKTIFSSSNALYCSKTFETVVEK